MNSLTAIRAGALLAGCLLHGAVWACPDGDIAPASPSGASAPRVPCVSTPPVIDGRLDDPAWADAAVLDGFRQVNPAEGAEPSEHTEVRLLYSRNALYVGVRSWDASPEGIRASVLTRDAELTPDDHVSIVIDPLDSGRDGYVFQLNPLGARRDLLVHNSGDTFPRWQGIWFGAASVDEAGWTAEFEIPIRTMAFDSANAEWGFNVARQLRRRNEESRWTAISRDLAFENVSQAGRVGGLQGFDRGVGLDLKAAGALRHGPPPGGGADSWGVEPSLNAFYRVTPSLTAALTANTDFSEAPIDDRQVNLDRFSLFFPETRDFFLQDAGVFEFGDGMNNGRPFHSRRIGMVGGDALDLRAGGRLTGRIGRRYNVGVLNAQVGSAPWRDLGARNLTAARLTADVLDESTVGAIVTHGDPAGGAGNSVAGADLRYRNSRVGSRGRTVTATAWGLRSRTPELEGGEHAWGAEVAWPNDRVNAYYRFRQLERNFNPALGFANRVDVREHGAMLRYRWRPETGPLRYLDGRQVARVTTNLDDRVESAQLNTSTIVNTHRDDLFRLWMRTSYEALDQGFALPFGMHVRAGRYTFVRPRLELESSQGRAVALTGSLEAGPYFDGRRVTASARVEGRPTPFLQFGLGLEHDRIALPGGSGIVRIGSADLRLSFSPDLYWAGTVQYDNVSEYVQVNSRLQWITRPGSELFLVVNRGFSADGWKLGAPDGDITLKFGHTMRL